jgi:hypothetical protein
MKSPAVVYGCLLFAASVLFSGCVRPVTRGAGLSCGAASCAVSVQNSGLRRIAVRYDDSTGRGEALGSVAAGDIRTFTLPWVRAKLVTITVTDYGTPFSDDVSVRGGWLVALHYPDDFSEVQPGAGVSRPH